MRHITDHLRMASSCSIHWFDTVCWMTRRAQLKVKIKVIPRSLRTVQAVADLQFLSRQPVADVGHIHMGIPGSDCQHSPPGPRFTFPATGHHRHLTGTNLYCLVTEAYVCEQLTLRLLAESRMAQS